MSSIRTPFGAVEISEMMAKSLTASGIPLRTTSSCNKNGCSGCCSAVIPAGKVSTKLTPDQEIAISFMTAEKAVEYRNLVLTTNKVDAVGVGVMLDFDIQTLLARYRGLNSEKGLCKFLCNRTNGGILFHDTHGKHDEAFTNLLQSILIVTSDLENISKNTRDAEIAIDAKRLRLNKIIADQQSLLDSLKERGLKIEQENNSLLKKRDLLDKETNELEKERCQLDSDLKSLCEELIMKQTHLKKVDKRDTELTKRIARMEVSMERHQEERRSNGENSEILSSLRTENSKLVEELKTKKDEYNELIELYGDIVTLRQKINSLQTVENEGTRKMGALQAAETALVKNISHLTTVEVPLRARVLELCAQEQRQNASSVILLDRERKSIDRLNQQSVETMGAKHNYDQLVTAVEEHNMRLHLVQHQIDYKKDELKELFSEIDSAEKRLNNLRECIKECVRRGY
jgi:chromosome segregation ATPase